MRRRWRFLSELNGHLEINRAVHVSGRRHRDRNRRLIDDDERRHDLDRFSFVLFVLFVGVLSFCLTEPFSSLLFDFWAAFVFCFCLRFFGLFLFTYFLGLDAVGVGGGF